MATTNRETIQANSMLQARMTCKRAVDHKALIRKFIKTFESSSSDDLKFGKRKYKAALQQAVNDKIGTVFVDLNDVEEFCKKEIMEPDEQISQSPVQLQQAIEN